MNEIYCFPEYFNNEAIKEIEYWGREKAIHVYRVDKYGNTKKAFLNYYEEAIKGLKPVRDLKRSLEKYSKNIDSLSVSCYYDKKDIDYYFSVTLKKSCPKRVLLEGYTMPVHGLSLVTGERKSSCLDSHTDWWLFKGSRPWEEFKEVIIDE